MTKTPAARLTLTATPAPRIRPTMPLPIVSKATPAEIERDRQSAIADIRRMNPTATATFLNGFSLADLRDYLEHLRHAKHKNVRLPGWVQRRTMRLAEARRTLRKAG